MTTTKQTAIAAVETKQIEQLNKSKDNPRATVQIQFCNGCDAHLFTVRHQEGKYREHYQNLKKKLRDNNIAVRKRPVPHYLYKKSPYCQANVYYKTGSNQIEYFPQIGSFEIYFMNKKIFSKLQTIKWPNYQTILFQIQKLLLEESKQTHKTQKFMVQGAETKKVMYSKMKKGIIKQSDYYLNQFKESKDQGKLSKIQNHNERYSIFKRNLFVKYDSKMQTRKSLTARNSAHHQLSISHTRENKMMNEEDLQEIKEQLKDKKKQIDIINMYTNNTKVVNKEAKTQRYTVEPEIIMEPVKTKRGKGVNVYLQPIFPKTSVNLQNYQKQRLVFSHKIHEQRKLYEVDKLQRRLYPRHYGEDLNNTGKIYARFNEDASILNSQNIQSQKLKEIKEITEENQPKLEVKVSHCISKDNKINQQKKQLKPIQQKNDKNDTKTQLKNKQIESQNFNEKQNKPKIQSHDHNNIIDAKNVQHENKLKQQQKKIVQTAPNGVDATNLKTSEVHSKMNENDTSNVIQTNKIQDHQSKIQIKGQDVNQNKAQIQNIERADKIHKKSQQQYQQQFEKEQDRIEPQNKDYQKGEQYKQYDLQQFEQKDQLSKKQHSQKQKQLKQQSVPT